MLPYIALVRIPRGDPTLAGWLITVGYAAVAILCARAAWTAQTRGLGDSTHRTDVVFWLALGAAVFALAVNKQLDLQSDVTALAKGLAQRQGWYEERRTVQVAFIAMMFGGIVVGIAATVRFVRHVPRDGPLALIGVACVAVFALLRAAQFHHVAGRLPSFGGSLPLLSVAFEVAGGVSIGYAAWRAGSDRPTVSSASLPE